MYMFLTYHIMRKGMVIKMTKKKLSTLLSVFFWGSGQFFVCKQRRRGLIYFLIQFALVFTEFNTGYWANYFAGDIANFKLRLYGGYFTKGIWGLITLGTETGKNGDHSTILMINGITALILILAAIGIYILNIIDAYKTGEYCDNHSTIEEMRRYNNIRNKRNFPYIVMIPVAVIIIMIVFMPIVFSILTAFTNYDTNHLPPLHLIDWVGFKNFKRLFTLPIWTKTFFSVLLWNVIWAVSATITTYVLGLIQALFLNNKLVKLKSVFRFIYILPWAIPGMISLLVFKNMLNGQFGPLNNFLMDIGVINNPIPFLTNPTTAKITIILVNLWLGFPSFMLMIIGILSNQDTQLYEAAQIDGATKIQIFFKVKLPLLLHATAPLIIMNFAGNFNAFGSIYFLTEGNPVNTNYQFAGDTDILISWIYKLTLDQRLYSMAAVMNILIFIFIGAFSVWNIRRTSSYKEA